MLNHKALYNRVPSVEDIVAHTDNEQTLVNRLQCRTKLLWWRTIWCISFVAFWALIILTFTQVISNDWYLLTAFGVFAAAYVKWYFSSYFCEELNNLVRAIQTSPPRKRTDSAIRPLGGLDDKAEATDGSASEQDVE